MRVVILCAPNKGACRGHVSSTILVSTDVHVKHTLGKKATEKTEYRQRGGQIFAAALCTVSDLKRVRSYIEGERRGGKYTVTLVDECDEITQGKGGKSRCRGAEDPDAYQEFIRPIEEARTKRASPRAVGESRFGQKSRKENLQLRRSASSSIHDKTQIIACSATLNGYILNPIRIQTHVVTTIFKVFPKPSYRRIETFKIPERCQLDTEGNLTLDQFQESQSVATLLKRFYERKNACDGKRLLLRRSPAPGPEPGPSGTSEAGSVRFAVFCSFLVPKSERLRWLS